LPAKVGKKKILSKKNRKKNTTPHPEIIPGAGPNAY
jgi:hypothetical protein